MTVYVVLSYDYEAKIFQKEEDAEEYFHKLRQCYLSMGLEPVYEEAQYIRFFSYEDDNVFIALEEHELN